VSAHWRLAGWYTLVLAALGGAAALSVGLWLGWEQAGALSYGVTVGLLCFLSTAATVSMLTGGSAFLKVFGAASFVARYGFVAAALGVPAYLGLWPATAMMAGFAGVYLAENLVLLPGVVGAVARRRSTGAVAGGPEGAERVERRVTV
jgi:hypothetical protein